MLTNSYIHLPKIGAATEKKIWYSGIKSWDEFRDDNIFLDIETIGLFTYYNEITMIGVHSSDGTKVFISGIDLEEFPHALKGCKVIDTFNRARFDLSFIEQHLPGINFDQLHIDLLYPLRRPGLSWGLKRFETGLGLSRSGETTGLSGFDAVRLWYQYKRGSQAVMDKLVRYNIEYIQNLETIIEMLYPLLMENVY